MVSATSGRSNKLIELTTDGVLGLETRWFPYRLWYSIVTSYVEPGKDFWYICYDCFGYEAVSQDSFFDGFNIVQASVPLNSKFNETIYEQTANYCYETFKTAQEIAEEFFNAYCVRGVIVAKQAVTEHLRAYDFEGIQFVLIDGTTYKII